MTRRWFELPGIRSWRARRRTGKEGRADNGASTAGGDADLTAVLDRWDRRVSREEEERRSARDRKERFRRDAARLMRSVIAPALEDIGDEIGARGHGWTVEERVDIQGQPGIAGVFAPATVDGARGTTSEVCFRFQFPDRLAVTGAVAVGGGLEDLAARSYDLAELGPGLVKKEVIRLITAALERV